MCKYIAIDGGTTTTRVAYISDEKITEKIKLPLGARANMESPGVLQNAVSEAINTLIEKHGAPEIILAAGMITSEFGLYNLPHVNAPAGIGELAKSAQKVLLPDICSVPFCFVPGVKTVGNLEKADMMRGEECEVFGISHGDGVYVLPGSHSKIINLKDGKITDFKTLLTGEMTASLCTGTILRDAVDLSASLEESYLIGGYRYCREHGLNEALFKVRVLKNLLSASRDEVYSFFLGAVLEGEIQVIRGFAQKRFSLQGAQSCVAATALILKADGISATEIGDQEVKSSTFLGMIKVYENKKDV